ncbi:MAG: polysaccharide deacetylase family protein [Candidatus Omnitrophota bacterium]
MSRRKIVIWGFDMESDVGSYTNTHRGVREATPTIISLFKKYDVRATFFFTALAAFAVPEAVKEAAESGFEIGCHGYQHESFGKGVFEAVGALPIFPEEIPGRISKATKVLEEMSGNRPISFRAPRYQASSELLLTLADQGYKVDASYPMYFFGDNLEPYYPSRSDWTKKGDIPVLEIPVFADLTVNSQDPLLRDRDLFSVLRLEGADAVKHRIDRMLQGPMSNIQVPVVGMALHPWELVTIPPVLKLDEGEFHLKEFLYKGTGDYTVTQLDRLIGLLQSDGCEIMTMADFFHQWEKK